MLTWNFLITRLNKRNVCYFEICQKVYAHLFLLLLLSKQHSHVFLKWLGIFLRILKQKEHGLSPINLQLSENSSLFGCNLFRPSLKNKAPDQAAVSFILLSDILTHFDPKLNRMKNVFLVFIYILEIPFQS